MKKWLMRVFNVKDEKGLTLIELLAVIVILGIIAAIAVPAITGITSSTKKEAHKANARQMIETAKQMVAINGFNSDVTTAWSGYKVGTDGKISTTTAIKTGTTTSKNVMEITLQEMIDAKYFNSIKNPETNSDYNTSNEKVYVYKDTDGTYLYFIEMDDVTDFDNPLLETEIDKLKLD